MAVKRSRRRNQERTARGWTPIACEVILVSVLAFARAVLLDSVIRLGRGDVVPDENCCKERSAEAGLTYQLTVCSPGGMSVSWPQAAELRSRDC